ncbi:hypothetical protein KIPB_000865 [Kipferlia bialata]|uniref:Uncharacterized protein n=1 Tax=Kipferlia bialata TaxID=797122 RepID=A0A9K3CMY7_9EUKA|nr:hypothetical protein KIPB_000865 [Kipferlia bialata]|eukprot:g865.t1
MNSGYVKQSILRRPPRQPTKKNDTTDVEVYEREMARVKTKQEEYQRREFERLRALYGTLEDKREMQQELKRVMENLLEEKARLATEEREEEKRIAKEMADYAQFAEYIEADQAAARLEYEKYLLAENKRLADQRQNMTVEERQAAIEADRSRPNFFEESFMKSFR